MADDADMAQERMEREAELNRRPAFDLKFTQGECADCGEEATLVNHRCGECRRDAERRGRS